MIMIYAVLTYSALSLADERKQSSQLICGFIEKVAASLVKYSLIT